MFHVITFCNASLLQCHYTRHTSLFYTLFQHYYYLQITLHSSNVQSLVYTSLFTILICVHIIHYTFYHYTFNNSYVIHNVHVQDIFMFNITLIIHVFQSLSCEFLNHITDTSFSSDLIHDYQIHCYLFIFLNLLKHRYYFE